MPQYIVLPKDRVLIIKQHAVLNFNISVRVHLYVVLLTSFLLLVCTIYSTL